MIQIYREDYIFSFIFYPITIILVGVSWISKKIFKEKDKDKQLTEEEFSMLVEDMNEDGVLNDIEEDIIQNTIEYGDTKVEDIMKEKIRNPKDNRRSIMESSFSRVIFHHVVSSVTLGVEAFVVRVIAPAAEPWEIIFVIV